MNLIVWRRHYGILQDIQIGSIIDICFELQKKTCSSQDCWFFHLKFRVLLVWFVSYHLSLVDIKIKPSWRITDLQAMIDCPGYWINLPILWTKATTDLILGLRNDYHFNLSWTTNWKKSVSVLVTQTNPGMTRTGRLVQNQNSIPLKFCWAKSEYFFSNSGRVPENSGCCFFDTYVSDFLAHQVVSPDYCHRLRFVEAIVNS